MAGEDLAVHRRMSVALLAGAAGVAAILVGTAVLTDVTATWRVVLVLAGLVGSYLAVDAVAARAVGRRVDTLTALAGVWLVVIVTAAVFADLLPLSESRDIAAALQQRPLQRPDLFSEHPLGTDRQALDLLGQVIYGARVSLQVSVGAVALGMAVGATLGVLAGYYRGWLGAVVALITDTILGFPPIILLLALVTILDPSVRNLVIGLAVLGIPTYVRLARAHTLAHCEHEYVLAARAMGARHRRIIWREIVPNVVMPLLSYAFVIVAVLIIAEASLSFLGLGIQRPEPSWGNMIAAGQSDFQRHPHTVFVPGIAIFATVYALNLVGEKAQRRWDPGREAT